MSNPIVQNSLANLGFRIFFLSAAAFSVVSIAAWMAVYFYGLELSITSLSITQWHAHEMIYGYCFAVIAGFVLTAVSNWTGLKGLHGKPLIALFCLWLIPRILFLTGGELLLFAMVSDALFAVGVIYAITLPIVKSKQWKQLIIVSKLAVLLMCNLIFYAGLYGQYDDGIMIGIYGGLYLVIGLILTIGRRVLPFFISKGVDKVVVIPNNKWLDLSALLIFIAFYVTEVFLDYPLIAACFALALSLIHSARLILWHTIGLWKKSLLWSIYLGFWFISLGFALLAAARLWGLNEFLAIHAFTFGGIGVITIGMMSRVALGHTGRGISNPSPALSYAFLCLLLGAVIRVIFPLFASQYYTLWIGLSLIMWLISFCIFVFIYAPILFRQRIDGRDG